MTRMVHSTLIAGGLLAASITAFAQVGGGHHGAEPAKSATTIKGELIDTACYVASDGDAKGKDHAACAAKCLGSGVPAAILPEGSTDPASFLFLLTNPRPLAAHAGKTIHVEGTANAKMHSIDVKKLHVVEADGKMTEIKLDDEHHKMGGGADAAKDDGHKSHKH